MVGACARARGVAAISAAAAVAPELSIYYQKYLKVNGVIVTAPSEVSDAKMEQAGEIVTGMYAGRPAYFEALSDNLIRIALFKSSAQSGSVNQLPEMRFDGKSDGRGKHTKIVTGWQLAAAWDGDDRCYVRYPRIRARGPLGNRGCAGRPRVRRPGPGPVQGRTGRRSVAEGAYAGTNAQ